MTPTWTSLQRLHLAAQTQMRSAQTAYRKYLKRVWASCRLSKGSLWMKAQLKRISDIIRTCGDMTIGALEQSRIVLLQKTTTPLRCEK